MGLFFKSEKRSLSSRSESMLDFITNADGSVTINFDGETALEQSDVFTAIKILSGDIAASKFKFVDEKNTNPQKLDLLNAKPNSSMTPYTFMFATMAQMLLSGNSFAIIHDDWLEFAKPSQVVVYEDLDNGLMRYEYTNKAGTSYKVDSYEMLHFKYVTVNGKTGISPLDALKTELSMLDNGNKMLSSFFKKGIQSGGVLKLNKGNINNTSRKQIKKDFEEVNSGASNANSVIVLDETQDFKQFEINTDILKMIQNNVYSTKQIAKAFGIPLSRFGMELVNTKDDAANDVYVSSTLRALARMITDELFIKLGIKVELDFSTLTGQDTASRMNKAMDGGNGGDGYLLVNEIRNYYGLADIPGGNIIYTKTTARGGVNNGNGNSEPSGSSIRENRTIEGYALKFNSLSKDLGGFKEIISPEALANTDLSDVRCFIDHDSSMVLGRTASQTLELNVDEIGLHFRCQLPNTTYANDLYESINRGDINECSFGFVVRDDSQTWTQENGMYIRNLNSIDELFEISIVSIPAYNGTDAALAQRSLKRAIDEQEKRKLQIELELLNY